LVTHKHFAIREAIKAYQKPRHTRPRSGIQMSGAIAFTPDI
jgi:hypothetical protein